MFRLTLRFSMLRWCVWLPLALGGCGGKSSDVDDKNGNEASSGGSTGTGGSDAGANGSGASSGDSDGAGGTSSGDSGSSGGNGGSSSGVGSDATGDASATSSGGGGGNGAASATSSGGTGQATTTSGSGTTGVINPTPPEDLVQGCARSCMAETGSGCGNAPSASDCAGACAVITRVESCNEVVREFFECLAEDDGTSCSDEGDVVFDACVSEQLEAYSCILQNAPDDDLEEPCEAFCGAQADADCELSEDVAGCVLGCTAIPTVLPACEASWVELLACTENREFSCDDEGEPTVQGCAGEYLGFLACAYPEVGD